MKLKETIIKALSLGTGLAVGLLLIAKVCHEMSYDRCYSNPEEIYQIRTWYSMQGETDEYNQIPGAVAPGFKEYIPGVKTATRWGYVWNSDRFIDENRNVVEGSVVSADTCFFEVFDTEILAGDPKIALNKILTVMVSESFAEKLGGISKAIGMTIQNEEQQGLDLTIEGVFKDFPHHSSVKHDVLLSMVSINQSSSDNWFGNDAYRGYVRLAEGTDPDMLAPAIRLMQEQNYPAEIVQMAMKSGLDLKYTLYPLVDMHTNVDRVRNMIAILTIVAMLLIMISLLNYVLMSVSALVKRSKEMGVRKCYGAGSLSIYGIMMKEAVVDMAAAILMAIIIIVGLKPMIEDLIGVPVDALFVNATYITAAVVLLVVFAIAAVVPGYLYSKIPAGAAIRNYKENKRVWKLALLFIQTGICALLLTLLFVISTQYERAINDKPGYEYENLLWTVLTGTDKEVHQGIIDQLMNLQGVEDVQMSHSLPLDYSSGNNVLDPENIHKELFNIADQYEGTAGLFEMLEIPFVEGRYPQNNMEVAVSESFVEKMSEFVDWSDGAVGKHLYLTEHSTDGTVFTICGVYRDYRISTLTNEDGRASVKFFGEVGKDYMPYMAIKVSEVSPAMIAKVEETIQARIENKDVEVNSYKTSMKDAYSGERRMRNTVMIGCVVSIIIALFGLIGYIRDESQRRSKEMAVRKINGASVKEIIGIYVKDILRLSIPALILGNTGAYFAATLWLKNFSEKIALSPWYFILADIVIIALVSFCIIMNSLRISRSNPVDSLKNE